MSRLGASCVHCTAKAKGEDAKPGPATKATLVLGAFCEAQVPDATAPEFTRACVADVTLWQVADACIKLVTGPLADKVPGAPS